MKEQQPSNLHPADADLPPEALALLTREIAERYEVCPLAYITAPDGQVFLTVATTEPGNAAMRDQLQQLLGCRILLSPATEAEITRGIARQYRALPMDTPRDLLAELGIVAGAKQSPGAPTASVAERTITTVVEDLIQRAVNERATDIHLQPHAKSVLVRFRIDGIMYDVLTYDPALHAQTISRLKILANLDIAQNRLPQDGRFDIPFGDRLYDVRVSIVPIAGGEKAVLRLLPKSHIARDLRLLGYSDAQQELLREIVEKPFGMLLVTGPTGSGKTTTIYALLSRIDCAAKNVITIEDPIEYQLKHVSQIQVHPKIGLTFDAGLRAILRQDPDVILVGEIRDEETLVMAVQASLTGHLVLSTLHCNDAAAAAARLIDMGAEPYLIASSLSGIVAQRLVRRVCAGCGIDVPVPESDRQRLHLPGDILTTRQGKGCEQCRNTGYRGRQCVSEILVLTEQLQAAIIRKESAGDIRELMRKLQIPTLRDSALEKVRAGIISLEEYTRAVMV